MPYGYDGNTADDASALGFGSLGSAPAPSAAGPDQPPQPPPATVYPSAPVPQGQAHPSGFAGLLSKVLPAVQAISAGVAAGYGNPGPAKMVMAQQQQDFENKRQLNADQQLSQIRNLDIMNKWQDYQTNRENARLNPPMGPQEKLDWMTKFEKAKSDMNVAKKEPKYFSISNPDGTTTEYMSSPVDPGKAMPVMTPNPNLNAPASPAEAYGPGAQGPVAPDAQAQVQAQRPEMVPLQGMAKAGKDVNTEEDLKNQIDTALRTGHPEQVPALQARIEALHPPTPEQQAILNMSRQKLNDSQDKAANDRMDRSYNFNATRLNKVGDPITSLNPRIARLQETLDQKSPEADALVAPELLTIMAGGQGSGLRMNEAEIARIVGGRSEWENLKANINHWKANPANARSITPAQDQQIRSLVSAVQARYAQATKIIEDGHGRLINAQSPEEHRKIVADTEQSVNKFFSGGQQNTQGQQEHPVYNKSNKIIGYTVDGKNMRQPDANGR